jgi:hypothetical protein
MGTWKCTKCGNSTWAKNKPIMGFCYKGGGHRWVSADSGTKASTWRCSKCGNSIVQGNT